MTINLACSDLDIPTVRSMTASGLKYVMRATIYRDVDMMLFAGDCFLAKSDPVHFPDKVLIISVRHWNKRQSEYILA